MSWVVFNIKSCELSEIYAPILKPTAGRWVYEYSCMLNADDVPWMWMQLKYINTVYQFSTVLYKVNDAAKGSQSMAPTLTVGYHRPYGHVHDPYWHFHHHFRHVHGPYMHSDHPHMHQCPQREEVIQPMSLPLLSACQSTITEYTGGIVGHQGGVLCAGQLIFEDNFDGSALDLQLWLYEQRLPLDNGDAEFVLYRPLAQVEDGLMRIEPMLYTEMDIRNGSFELNEGCTVQLDRVKECKRNARFKNVLQPVVSGRINTRHSFSFKYGRVEVRAKLPQGNWLFPLVLLEPLTNAYGLSTYDSRQLRIAFARGNSHLTIDGLENVTLDGHTLYGGAMLPVRADLRARSLVNTTHATHFGAEFHDYEMTWNDHELSFAVDGTEYGRLLGKFANLDYVQSSSAQAWQSGEHIAPFDQKFFITLGVSAGGHVDFPDKTHDKPCVNTDSKAMFHFWKKSALMTDTWTSPALQVDYVHVYAI